MQEESTVVEPLAALRRLLAAVEAGEVGCDRVQLDRLRGAEAALVEVLVEEAAERW